MKHRLPYLSLLAIMVALSSCGTTSYYSSTVFDDAIYYRPTAKSRAAIVENNQKAREQKYAEEIGEVNFNEYFTTDSLGNIVLAEGMTYEELLNKFNGQTYTFNYNYGCWADPWYNPWWGNWRYPWGPCIGIGVGWAYWNRWYYDPWFYDPWYYDPWYYNPWHWHHPYGPYGPGGIAPEYGRSGQVVYGKREGGNGQTYQHRGGSSYSRAAGTSTLYGPDGTYTGRRSSTGRSAGSSYTRSAGTSSGSSATRSSGSSVRSSRSGSSSGYTRSSGYTGSSSGYTGSSNGNSSSYDRSSSGSSYTRSSGESSYTRSGGYSGGGYSGGGYSGGGFSGGGHSGGGGFSGGGGHSGGGRR